MELEGCSIPDELFIDLENEVWWRWDPEGPTARIGILSTLASFAGLFRGVEFRPVTGTVGAGRSVATVESTRYTGAVRLAVDAELLERNDGLSAHPRWLNDRTYTDGWVARVRPLERATADRTLAPAGTAAPRLRELIRERRIRCWPRAPDAELVETGAECSAVLARLNEEFARRAVDETVLLVTDDPTSPIEMVRWSDQTGYPVLAQRREGSVYWFLLEKIAAPVPRRRRG